MIDFPQIYSSEVVASHLKEVQDTLYKLYDEYIEFHRLSNIEQSVEIEAHMVDLGSCSSGFNVSGRAKFYSFIRNVDTIQLVKSELDVYLEESVYICSEVEAFDVLDWWKMNNLKFRILSKMAYDVLSISITTVILEATFSTSGRVIYQYRSNLGTNTVQMLLCGEDWFRAFYGIKRKRKVSIVFYFILFSLLLVSLYLKKILILIFL